MGRSPTLFAKLVEPQCGRLFHSRSRRTDQLGQVMQKALAA
jgi:hypothetical protein